MRKMRFYPLEMDNKNVSKIDFVFFFISIHLNAPKIACKMWDENNLSYKLVVTPTVDQND